MKVVIEKDQASDVFFDKNKEYIVLKNNSYTNALGTCKISYSDGILYADLKLTKNAKGYPSIGYRQNDKSLILTHVVIHDRENIDMTIEPIEYTLQLEGKPSNLKTK